MRAKSVEILASSVRGFRSTLLVLFVVAAAPFSAFAAATLSLSPTGTTQSIGTNFSVKVYADGAGAAMNAVEATLTYDPSLLSVVAATKDGSIFSLWTTEPSFDNAKGIISFGGGNPKPFTAKSSLATITFKPLKAGTAKVEFGSASVLAADGKGTDITGDKLAGVYELSGAAPKPEPEPEPPPEEGGLVPDAPVIKSTTHPDENGWYRFTEGDFNWELLPDVTAARLALSARQDAKPSVLYQPAVAEKHLINLEEGVWYLVVQLKNGSGWGKSTPRKIQVDQTPPMPFSVSVASGATSTQPVLLIGSTTDALSGLDHYEVIIGTEQPVQVKLTEVVGGMYKITPHGRGSYTVTVTAYDKAGNATEARTNIAIEEELGAKKTVQEEKPSFWSRFGTLIIILILIIIIIALIIMNTMAKAKVAREMRRGAKEAEEIRQKMEKIFSALKDEVEEQINALDKKPRLSDAEKRAIGKIKEAIDISEELIGKEIDDVEKI